MDQISRLIARWKSHGISCTAGVSPDEIIAFESRRNVSFPSDLRSYFLAVNGMGEFGTCDEDLFCFWPIDHVKTIAAQVPDRCSLFCDAEAYFIIADHSICLPSYAIRLSRDPAEANPVASVFTDFGALKVENFFCSFTDFINNYLDDPFKTSVALPSNI